MKDIENTDVIDGLYTVAMEPERFRELVDVWNTHIKTMESATEGEKSESVELLSRHLTRAETIIEMVGSGDPSHPTPLHEKIEQEPQAMMAVNAKGEVEALNEAAAQLFSVAEGQGYKNIDLPRRSLDRIAVELRRRFKAMAQAKAQEEKVESLPSLIRFERHDADSTLLISFSDWEAVSGRHLILLKTTNFIWPEFLTPVISKAFGLTDAEADIVRLTVEGASIPDLAEQRGSSVATVRSQIRNIYAKTATKNQAEFIRMAIGLTTLQLVDREHGKWLKPRLQPDYANRSYPQSNHQYQLDLPDGRVMEYAVFGALTGKPVLFFHNERLVNVWPAKIAEYAAIRGLKIIIPLRPYYGRSDPYPKGVNHLEQTAEDFKFLLDFLHVEKAVFLAHTLGGAYALSMVTRYPECCAGMLALSPSLPHGDLDDEKKMPRTHRFVTSIVLRFPQLLEFIGRAGYKYYKRVGPKRYLYYIYGHAACDVAVIEDPVYQEALFRGLDFASEQKHVAYVAGYKHMPKNAEEMIINLPMPLHVIIGDSDKNTRFARAKHLNGLGANIDVIKAKNGADLLIFTHPTLVIDTVCNIFKEKNL